MELQELGVVTPTGPQTNIAAAINAAKTAPGAAVWIPAWYTGSDSVPATPGVPVFDLRGSSGTFTGGVGVGSGASPVMAFYLSNQCPQTNTGNCFYTPADTLQFNDCNWTNSTTTLSCTTAHFAASDVGKSIMGAQSFADDSQGSGNGGQFSLTANVTIAGFISPTQVTLSAIPANACAANCQIYFGHLDDAGFAAVDAAMQAANTCPKLFSASAYYYVTKPYFKVNPPSCAAQGPGQGSAGTTTLPAGFEWEGRGVGPTTIVHDPSFPNGDPCTSKSTAQVNGGCWSIPLMGKWTGLRFDGGNQPTMPNMNSKTLITMAVATLENFTCTNMGYQNASSMVGLNLGLLSQLYQVNNAGCGTIGLQTEGGGQSSGFRVVVENSSTNALLMTQTGTLTCYWCIFDLPLNASSTSVIRNNGGGTLRMFGGVVQPFNFTGGTGTGITGYRCAGVNGAFYGEGVYFFFTTAEGGSSHNALWAGSAGCTVNLSNSIIDASAASSTPFTDFGSTSGTKLYSVGGNTYKGAFSILANAGVFLAPTDNLSAASAFSPTCAATTGGTTCSILAGGSNEKGTMRITASAAATGTVTLTFLGTFAGPTGAAPRCTTAYVNGGGTGSWSITATTPIVQTVRSTTVPVFNWNQTGNLTAASTYDIDYVCSAM